MTRDLNGRVALITGAGGGIGRAVAIELAAAGCEVALIGRNVENLEATAAECAAFVERVMLYCVDINDHEALEAVVEDLIEDCGSIDILVNNAGLRGPTDVERSLEEDMLTVHTNLNSLMALTHLCAPYLRQGEGPRAVINIASVLGKIGLGGSAAYCASKHGVVGYTAALFEDLRGAGVKVSAICPGFVNTEMVAGRGLAGERMIQPEDVALAVRFVAEFPATGCPTEIVLQPQLSPYPA